MNRSIFRSAITDENGDVDAGYLGLYVVMLLVLGTIPSTILLAVVRMMIAKDNPLDLVGIAAVIGAAGAAFGTAAAGVGIFRVGDKPRAPAPASVTKTESKTETVTVAPAAQPVDTPRD